MTKEEKSAYYKNWRDANKEHIKEYQRNRYIREKEKMIARSVAYNKSDKRKVWREKNKEKIALCDRDRNQRNKVEKMPQLRMYGITVHQYKEMSEQQGNKCLICNILATELNRPLNVDHCHSSGKIRGLLCGKCNTALGMAKESIETLHNLINYLQNV